MFYPLAQLTYIINLKPFLDNLDDYLDKLDCQMCGITEGILTSKIRNISTQG